MAKAPGRQLDAGGGRAHQLVLVLVRRGSSAHRVFILPKRGSGEIITVETGDAIIERNDVEIECHELMVGERVEVEAKTIDGANLFDVRIEVEDDDGEGEDESEDDDGEDDHNGEEDDFDLASGTLFIRHQLQEVSGKPELTEPKTATGRRRTTLPKMVVEALVAHFERMREEGWTGPCVFCDTNGGPDASRRVPRRFASGRKSKVQASRLSTFDPGQAEKPRPRPSTRPPEPSNRGRSMVVRRFERRPLTLRV